MFAPRHPSIRPERRSTIFLYPMKTLAIIIEQDTLSVHEARLVDTLRDRLGVSLLRARPDDLVDLRNCGRFYRFILAAETWLTSFFIPRIKEHRRRLPAKTVPLRSARNEAFDLVLNLTRGPVKRDLLPETTHGVLDLHYGNVRTGIEGPPGFWESCHEDSATGWWLSRGEECVFSARYKTKRTMCLNTESVLREAHIDLANELLRLAAGGDYRSVELPTTPVWTCPGPFDVIFYRLRTLWRELSFFLRTKARGKQLVFSVGIAKGHWQEADLSAATIVENPEGSYLADPFLLERDGRTVCYVEEFDLASERGRISWLDLSGGEPEYKGTLIEEPYHMSFPFPFEFAGELYMIPETFEAREISLYQCVSFPDRWERCGTLMEDVEASDTMVFEQDGRWWMLTNLRPEGALDFYSRLYLFWSDNPLSGKWTPHPLNPVLIDADGGRNGGLLFDKDRASGQVYRVGQHQSIMTYGAGWSIFRMDHLNTERYAESSVADTSPHTSGGIAGGHHVSGSRGMISIDILHLDHF